MQDGLHWIARVGENFNSVGKFAAKKQVARIEVVADSF